MDDKELSRFLYDIGMKLYRIREEAGLSRSWLQQKTKIHQNTIARYENGEASPTLRLIAVMADAMGYKLHISFEKKETDHETDKCV